MTHRLVNPHQAHALKQAMQNQPRQALKDVAKSLNIDYPRAKQYYKTFQQDKRTSKKLQDFKTPNPSKHKQTPKQPRKSQSSSLHKEADKLDQARQKDRLIKPGDEFIPESVESKIHYQRTSLPAIAASVHLSACITTANICCYINELDLALDLVEKQRESLLRVKRQLEVDLVDINSQIEKGYERTAALNCTVKSESSLSSD